MDLNSLVKTPLFPHQSDILHTMLPDIEGFANLSEMGTGKTLTSIAAMEYLRKENGLKRVLIVCMNSIKYNWEDELKKNAITPWECLVLMGSSKRRKESLSYFEWKKKNKENHALVVITNYESLIKLSEELSKLEFDLIIADEAHNIKNHKAQRTKALKSIPTKFKWALTGTPVAQNVLDIWSIYDWIRPLYFPKSFYAFRARYAHVYTGAGFPMIKGWKNQSELQRKVARYSVRVLKKECLNLPDKMFQQVQIDLSPEEKRVYDEMANEMIVEIGSNEVVAQTILTKFNKLQQMASGFVYNEDKVVRFGQSKLDALEELLDSLEDKKIVIWSRFKEELKQIIELAIKKSRSHVFLAQEMDEVERMEAIRKFQASTDNHLFIGNVGVGSAGINLFSAHHCIYFSNSWSLTDRLQSEDRLHRYGQKNAVNYYDLVSRGTIDSYILSVIQNKIQMSDKVTGDDLKKILFS